MTNYVAPHLYLQWGGTLPGGDIWSCGLRMSTVGAGTVDSAASMLDGAAAAVSAFHGASSGGVQINSRCVLTFVKLNAIGTNGKYMLQTTNEKSGLNVPGGIVDSNPPPNQVCLAISLQTAVARGAASKGRFYVPLPAYSIGTDGRIGVTYAENAGTGADTMIAALNALNTGLKVAVYGQKQGVLAQRLVTGVRVGRVLDTQRRRRNKLVEDYR